MDSITFRSFARTAMGLQSDDETPPDYVMIKAAVAAKYNLYKEAVSSEWVKKMTASGVRKASDSRIAKFMGNRFDFDSRASKLPQTPHIDALRDKNVDAARTARVEQRYRNIYRNPQTKLAWNSGELAGLGVLAAPAASNLIGKPMSEKGKDVAEVTGLGMLAAPYAHNIASKRSAGYAASGLGQHLERIFSH